MNESNRVQNLEQQQKIQDISSQFLEDYEVETWGTFLNKKHILELFHIFLLRPEESQVEKTTFQHHLDAV